MHVPAQKSPHLGRFIFVLFTPREVGVIKRLFDLTVFTLNKLEDILSSGRLFFCRAVLVLRLTRTRLDYGRWNGN